MSVASAVHLFADSILYSHDTRDDGISPYLLERRRFYTDASWSHLLDQLDCSSTLYVGNLSFFTTEEQVVELFSKAGPIKKLIMGLNRGDKTPCGFCFVEYTTHADAQSCQRFISGTSLDDRLIRADLDPGFEEGRQFGRSRMSGGQRRDDFRQDHDAGRGGWAPPPQKDHFAPMFAADAAGNAAMQNGEDAAAINAEHAEAAANAIKQDEEDERRDIAERAEGGRGRDSIGGAGSMSAGGGFDRSRNTNDGTIDASTDVNADGGGGVDGQRNLNRKERRQHRHDTRPIEIEGRERSRSRTRNEGAGGGGGGGDGRNQNQMY